MSSDIFMIVCQVLVWDAKQNGPNWCCRSHAFFGLSANGICNSETVICCSQTMHKTVLLNIHRPGHQSISYA